MQRVRIADWQPQADPDIAIFSIARPDGGQFAAFQAGQYVQLALWQQPADDPRPRQFSIASSPFQPDRLEVYVILVRDELPDGGERLGTFTGALWGCRPGDEILCMAHPAGRFLLSRTPQREVICIATGTGLAPFISMARGLWHEYQRTGSIDRRLTIIHGVSHARQLGYRDLLEEMAADEGFGLLYVPTVSRPDGDDDYTSAFCRGRANDLVRLHCGLPKSGRVEPWMPTRYADELRRRVSVSDSAVYICGNPDMIADAKQSLAGQGFEVEGREAQVITEDYW